MNFYKDKAYDYLKFAQDLFGDMRVSVEPYHLGFNSLSIDNVKKKLIRSNDRMSGRESTAAFKYVLQSGDYKLLDKCILLMYLIF